MSWSFQEGGGGQVTAASQFQRGQCADISQAIAVSGDPLVDPSGHCMETWGHHEHAQGPQPSHTPAHPGDGDGPSQDPTVRREELHFPRQFTDRQSQPFPDPRRLKGCKLDVARLENPPPTANGRPAHGATVVIKGPRARRHRDWDVFFGHDRNGFDGMDWFIRRLIPGACAPCHPCQRSASGPRWAIPGTWRTNRRWSPGNCASRAGDPRCSRR